MRRRLAVLGVVAASCVAGPALVPSFAAAAVPATCATGAPALRIAVDKNFGVDRRRAVSVANASGATGSAMKPINLIVNRNGRSRTIQFTDLQGEYRYTARPGEQASFVVVYAQDNSGFGPVTSPSSPIPQLDIVGITNQVTSLLGTLGLDTIAPGLISGLVNLVLPQSAGPAGFNSAVCTRTQAATVTENATASASRAKVRRANQRGRVLR